jgi:solute carrier family 9B (sodium/hydrogen exchanger), member 1/2
LFEALVIAFAAMVILDFDFLTGLLFGFLLGAESPAVIVPGMLRMNSQGLGVKKGIPDAILTGSALSDVLMLLGFSLLLNLISTSDVTSQSVIAGLPLPAFVLIPMELIVQIVLGLLISYLAARLLITLLARQQWTIS